MATANTNYSNDGMSTVTSVPGYDSGDNGMIDFWNAMARRRKAAAAPVIPKRTMGLGRATHAGPRSAHGTEGTSINGLKESLLRAQVSEAQAQAQAAGGVVPTKMHPGGAGYTSAFATPDVMGMTGAQRQAFLPGASHQVGGFDEFKAPPSLFDIQLLQDRERARQEMSREGGPVQTVRGGR